MPMEWELPLPTPGPLTWRWTSSKSKESRWRREERCPARRASSDAPNVFRTGWFHIRPKGVPPARVQIDVHAGVVFRSFFSLSFRIKGSFRACPLPRPYGNMFFSSYPASIFRFRPSPDRDGLHTEEGKGILRRPFFTVVW